jgi:hypothetical protein
MKGFYPSFRHSGNNPNAGMPQYEPHGKAMAFKISSAQTAGK